MMVSTNSHAILKRTGLSARTTALLVHCVTILDGIVPTQIVHVVNTLWMFDPFTQGFWLQCSHVALSLCFVSYSFQSPNHKSMHTYTSSFNYLKRHRPS